MDKILDVNNLKSGYGNVQILNGIDLYVEKNEFVTIIGPNGCGKSTFIKTIFGLCNYFSGDVFFQGNPITKIRSDLLISMGISYVPQVNNVFSSLSVYENLQIGSLLLDKNQFYNKLNYIYDLFPDLYSRSTDMAESLSGGERQMLAISRALLSNPKFLLLDEPTAALSPKFQKIIINKISELRDSGITILLVEQNAKLSLASSDRGYIFSNGKVVLNSKASKILNEDNISEYFLGKIK
ncbi:MAG: ABC transporter ATP-binding protein [Dehalococcoidia bacterium]|nr:ABC transporter ATP-binding protein [Dehalococcoidia bacterium]|tara:strand:+ start:1065 stop:1781 length:717 start_codon:yes stop_codon:yes gene_type:complete